MKINRLLEITILLMSRGTVTARELADRFGVNLPVPYTGIIDVLSVAGVPVYTCKGSNGGIHLMEGYSLNKTIVNEHEADSLVLALKTLQATRYPELSATLDKLGALFKRSVQNDWVRVDFSPWGSAPNDDNKFMNIKMAILNKNVISFDYLSSLGEKTARTVEPPSVDIQGTSLVPAGLVQKAGRNHRLFQDLRALKKLALTQGEFFRPRSDAKAGQELTRLPSVSADHQDSI